ncbi:MAG TPA: LLM class flavin-dependent oxidoreductase [Propionibacteriaceae bacterium]|nr:LLM class flavin-dependent oxidoreductase [Propionibacteriaceae bacterium]
MDGRELDEVRRPPTGGGQRRLTGDHPSGSGRGGTRRIGLGMVVGAADAAYGADPARRSRRTGHGCTRDVRHCVRRGAGFEEHILAMRAVWGPDPVSFEGRFYRIPEADIGPKPVRPGGPRLMAGAGSPVAAERAGRLGVGLTLVIFDWDTIRETIEIFRTAARAAGHDHDTLPIMLQVNGNITAEPVDEHGPLLGSPEQVAADLDHATKLGVEHIYWNSADDPLSQLPLLEQLAKA